MFSLRNLITALRAPSLPSEVRSYEKSLRRSASPVARYFIEKRVGVFTNSANSELLEMSTSLCREICKPIVIPGIDWRGRGFYGYRCFDRALSSRSLARHFDYLVYIDEDCFLLGADELKKMVEYFVESGCGFCGMPDGGAGSIRPFNPVAINPFFSIYDLQQIKRVYNRRQVRETVYEDSLRQFVSEDLYGGTTSEHREREIEQALSAHPRAEPYYRIFFFLLLRGIKPLYLKARVSSHDPEGITTELLDFRDGNPLCMHTWYARLFTTDAKHRERIKGIYTHALVESAKRRDASAPDSPAR